jgi:hypothetical protein
MVTDPGIEKRALRKSMIGIGFQAKSFLAFEMFLEQFALCSLNASAFLHSILGRLSASINDIFHRTETISPTTCPISKSSKTRRVGSFLEHRSVTNLDTRWK